MSRRDSVLREMGLGPLWKLRGVSDSQSDEAAPLLISAPISQSISQPISPQHAPLASAPLTPPPAPLAQPQGLSPAPARPSVRTSPPLMPAQAAPAVATTTADLASMDWPTLEQAVVGCRACGLCQKRKQSVFGVGDRQADWLFVGEGPGAEEDEKGEPFVGQAGKLLDAMLAAIQLRRGQDVYIANTVKCRPPGNRTPEAPEMAACFPYLERQIELIRPRLIVALGRPAAQTLLGEEVKIASVRGRLLSYRDIPLIVTYHPAYLLRNLPDKALAWADLCFARRTMQGLKNLG